MEAYLVFQPNLLLQPDSGTCRLLGRGTEPTEPLSSLLGYETIQNLFVITS